MGTHFHNSRRRSRGAAEIELLLATGFILIPMLFLTGTMLIIGPARINNAFNAEAETFHDATAVSQPVYAPASEVSPIDQPLTMVHPSLPPLPDRMHVAEVSRDVDPSMGMLRFSSIHLANGAVYPSGEWTMSGYPVPSDLAAMQNWFQQYSNETRDPDTIVAPLDLSPTWPP